MNSNKAQKKSESENISNHYFAIKDQDKLEATTQPSFASNNDLEKNSPDSNPETSPLNDLIKQFHTSTTCYMYWLGIWTILCLLAFLVITVISYISTNIAIFSPALLLWVLMQYSLKMQAITSKALWRTYLADILMILFTVVCFVIIIRAATELSSNEVLLFESKQEMIATLYLVVGLLILNMVSLVGGVQVTFELKQFDRMRKQIVATAHV